MLAAPLVIQQPATVSRKQLGVVGLLYHVGDGDPDYWLRPGPTLAVVDIWGMSQWMEDLFVYFSLSLPVTLFFK